MRNTFLKEIRNDFKDSRFFYGKNRVMAKGLGTSPETEYKEGLSGIAKVKKKDIQPERKKKKMLMFIVRICQTK